LKLENLLLESKSANANLKVIDFGTCRKFNPEEKLTRRIGTVNFILLSTKFISPTISHQKYFPRVMMKNVIFGLVE